VEYDKQENPGPKFTRSRFFFNLPTFLESFQVKLLHVRPVLESKLLKIAAAELLQAEGPYCLLTNGMTVKYCHITIPLPELYFGDWPNLE